MASMINCPYCGKLSDPKLESCPHCGGQLQRTRPMTPPPQPGGRGRQTCPNCHAMVQEGDIICVACGTNLLTGQVISGQQPAPKKKRSVSMPMPTPYVLGGAAIVLAVVLLIGFWVFLMTRDPVRQAERLARDEKYIEAIDVLQPYVENVADDERAYLVLGQILVEVSRYREAATAFEQAVRLNPSNADAALWAVVSLSAGSGPEARPRQVELLERVVEQEPDNAEAWFLLALARGTTNDIAGQVEALEQVVSMRPTEELARVAMGVALALQGDLGAAQGELAIVDAEASGRPGDILAVEGLIASMQENDEADDLLRGAIEGSEPVSIRFQALCELGRLLAEQGRFAEGEPYLRQALSLRPRDERAQFLLGLALAGRGNHQEALVEFTEVARSGGSFAVPAAVQEANIFLELDTPLRAQDALQRVSGNTNQLSAPYYTLRGRVAAAQDDMTTAQDSYRRAINADPTYAPAYLENGLLYVKNAQLAEGTRELERYLELVGPDTDNPEIRQIRELVTQLRQTSGQPPTAGA